MVDEREILLEAVKNLKSLTRRNDITIIPSGDLQNETDISIGEVRLSGKVKSYVNNANFNQMLLLIQEKRRNSKFPVLLIVGSISPQNLMKYADEGINVLDCSGNCYINIPSLYIYLSFGSYKCE